MENCSFLPDSSGKTDLHQKVIQKLLKDGEFRFFGAVVNMKGQVFQIGTFVQYTPYRAVQKFKTLEDTIKEKDTKLEEMAKCSDEQENTREK